MDKRLLKFSEYLGEAEGSKKGYIPTDQQILDIMKAQEEQFERWKKINKKDDKWLDEKGVGNKSINKMRYYFKTLSIYNSLDDAGKKGMMDSIKEYFKTKKKGLTEEMFKDKFKKWKKDLEKKENGYPVYNLYAIISPKDAGVLVKPVEKPGDEVVKLEDQSVIPPDLKNSLFKNNMWNIEKPDETFNNPEVGQEIKEDLKKDIMYDWFKFSDKGKHLIKNININSSCSRYRNTAPSENMSWVELAFKRAATFAKYIQDTAKEVSGGNAKYVDSIRALISLDYLGTNGDGTSGPDPGKNKEGQEVKKGYYLKNGEGLTDKKEGGLLKIGVVGVNITDGQPVLNGKVEMKDALGLDRQPIKEDPKSPEEYEKFKFIEVDILYNEDATINPDSEEPGAVISGEKTKTEGKKLEVNFPSAAEPSKGGRGGGTSYRRKRGKPAPSIPQKGKAIPCPAF
jgi:hypothetical protein